MTPTPTTAPPLVEDFVKDFAELRKALNDERAIREAALDQARADLAASERENEEQQQALRREWRAHDALKALVTTLREENDRLREALAPFILLEPWMDEHPDETPCSTFRRTTFGDHRRANAALTTMTNLAALRALQVQQEGR